MRQPADWMHPMDDRILELLQTTGITFSPAIIAYNLNTSREAVNRRLAELSERGLIERIERGRYKIAPSDQQYLEGHFNVEEL